jgi:hypothetical protein
MEAGIASALNGVGLRAETGKAAGENEMSSLKLSMPKKPKLFAQEFGYFLA